VQSAVADCHAVCHIAAVTHTQHTTAGRQSHAAIDYTAMSHTAAVPYAAFSHTAVSYTAISHTAVPYTAVSYTAISHVFRTATAHTAVFCTATAHAAVFRTATAHTAVFCTAMAHTAVFHTATAHTAVFRTATAHTAVFRTATAHTAVFRTATAHTAGCQGAEGWDGHSGWASRRLGTLRIGTPHHLRGDAVCVARSGLLQGSLFLHLGYSPHLHRCNTQTVQINHSNKGLVLFYIAEYLPKSTPVSIKSITHKKCFTKNRSFATQHFNRMYF
jgi:hypothetical protein